MVQAAAQVNLEDFAGVQAREELLARFEALSEEIASTREKRRANRYVQQSLKSWTKGDAARTAKFALKALQEDENNARACHVLAMAMERMGHIRKALSLYERAFELDPNDPNLLLDIGLTAQNLKMPEWAEKMFQHYIAVCPDSPLGYNNLGGIQCKKGNVSVGIETLRSAIYRMPNEAMLWNTLATALAEDGRSEEALPFYQEGLRLDPSFPRVWHNLGYAYSHLGRLEDALATYDVALSRTAHDSERIEIFHSKSLCQISLGMIEEGFAAYEIRHHPAFRAHVRYMTKAPLWQGETLEGRRFLAISEQGVGDEIMLANVLPDIARAVGPDGKLQIAVDKRLISLFQRSFPDAEVGTYMDRKLTDKEGRVTELRYVTWHAEQQQPDYFAPVGNAVRYRRKSIEDFPHQSFLKPDPARVAEMREKLKAFGPGPYVGICWRSMLLSGKRHKYYSALDMWDPILKTPGVTFVNVQYGECSEELKRASEKHGVAINVVEGLDLKDDLDGLAALSAALGLVIAAPTATAAMAGAVGTEVWFLTAARAWPQLGSDHYPWYRASRVFHPDKIGEWNTMIAKTADALRSLIAC